MTRASLQVRLPVAGAIAPTAIIIARGGRAKTVPVPTAGADVTEDALHGIIEVANELLRERSFVVLSALCKLLRSGAVHPSIQIALLRSTFTARSRIPGWYELARSLRSYLVRTGSDPDKKMSGLVKWL